MNRISKLIILLFAITAGQALNAQDATFSQAFASPLSLNPALTGSFDGKLRLTSVYHNQWANQLDNPISSYAASMDLRFPLGRFKANKQNALGFGLIALTDRTPGVKMHSNVLNISGAFHKSLNLKNTQFLSVGIQFGVLQRSLSYQSIFFSDQFNGTDGYDQISAEDLPENNFAVGDLSAGIVYQASNANNLGFYTGISFHHLNSPNSSFYSAEESGSINIALPTRYSAFVAARLPFGNIVQMLPRLNVAYQNNRLDGNAGTTFRFIIDKYNGTAIHLGSWIQADFDQNSNPELNYLVGMLGIEYSNVLFGFSRDFSLQAVNIVRKTWEVSVAYLGNYDDELVLCPKF
jgi:type IX secretion system PorP/SprF family membrane protein